MTKPIGNDINVWTEYAEEQAEKQRQKQKRLKSLKWLKHGCAS